MNKDKKFKTVEIDDPKNKLKPSEDIIWILLFVISFIHGLMCISQGILSSCVTEIKQELSLSDEEFSMFGTINGFGSLIGSLIFTLIIEQVSHKYLITSMLIINCLSHFAFFFKLKFSFLLVSRFISGFASVFCYIYFPMWVDEFGNGDWINFMQTTVQVSNTIGHIFGYFIYYLVGSKQWKYGFLTEIFSVCCLVLIMVIIPEIYYDNENGNGNGKKDFYEKQNYDEINVNTDEEVRLKNDNSNNNVINNNNHIVINNQLRKEKYTIMKDIILNLPYILITLYRANRLFIFVALDFWFSDYIQSSLLITNPSQIFLSYSLTIVLSPLLGLILGSIISNKIGGPKGKHSFKAMYILQIFSVIFGFLSNYQKNLYLFTLFMSLYMLLNCASGLISISASYAVIPKNLIGTATGIYSVFVNLFGFLPAPFAYAFLKNFFEKGNYIIIFLMGYGIFGAFDLIVADIYMKNEKIYIYK